MLNIKSSTPDISFVEIPMPMLTKKGYKTEARPTLFLPLRKAKIRIDRFKIRFTFEKLIFVTTDIPSIKVDIESEPSPAIINKPQPTPKESELKINIRKCLKYFLSIFIRNYRTSPLDSITFLYQ